MNGRGWLKKLARDPGEKSLAGLAFLGILVCYLPTLAHGLPGGDAGDLVTAACQGAVAHPPGYPLWVIMAKLMLLLPLGGTIWRLSLLSALLSSGAGALLTASLWRFGLLWPLTLLGAALFAFAANVWLFAVTPEVFALNSFLVMVAFYAAFRSSPGERGRWLFVHGLALGLGFANHHTSVALCGPLALCSLCLVRSFGAFVKGGLVIVGGTLLGLLCYAYLPISGVDQSIYSWGDTASWAGIWQHILRADYGTFRLSSAHTSASLSHNLWLYGSYLCQENFVIAPLFIALGFFGILRRGITRSSPMLWAVTAIILYLLVFHVAANLYLEYDLHRQVLSRFWIMPQLVVAMLMVIGLDEMARWRSGFLCYPVILLSFGLLGASPLLRFTAVSARDDQVMERFAEAEFAAMPEGSIALVRNDLSFPLVYLKACGGVRPDIRLINRAFLTRAWSREKIHRAYPDVILPAGLYTYQKSMGESDTYDLTEFIERNIDRHPIFLHEFAPGMDEYEQTDRWTGRFDVVSWGLLTRVMRHEPGRDMRSYDAQNRRLLALYTPPMRPGADRWTAVVRMVYVDAYYLRAMRLTQALLVDPTLFPITLAALQEAAALPDQNQARIYSTLGFAYAIEIRRDPTARARAIAAWQSYLRMAPQEDLGRGQIEERLAQLLREAPGKDR